MIPQPSWRQKPDRKGGPPETAQTTGTGASPPVSRRSSPLAKPSAVAVEHPFQRVEKPSARVIPAAGWCFDFRWRQNLRHLWKALESPDWRLRRRSG